MGRTLALLSLASAVLWFAGGSITSGQKPSVRARGQSTLDVVVIDETGKPLPGALVSVPGYRSTSGLGGTCRFGLLPGRYAILVSKPGYRGRRVNVGVRPGETTTTHVKLRKLPSPHQPKS